MKHKEVSFVLIVVSTIGLMSCSISPVETMVPENSFVQVESSQNQSSEIEYDYDVTPMSIDLTFDSILEKIGNMLNDDVADYFYTETNEDLYSVDFEGHHLVCIYDYPSFLSGLTVNDPSTGIPLYYPLEEETHQLRRFKIDDVSIDEYESEYWAEMSFRRISDIYIVSLGEDDVNEIAGYCFVIDESLSGTQRFFATYLIGDCTITYQYSYSDNDVNSYSSYLEVCEELGLPVNDQITADIIG